MFLIFTLSSIPGDSLPSVEFKWADKIAHFFVFGILGSTLYRGLFYAQRLFWRKYSDVMCILICFLYGTIDELHQFFIPGRYTSLSDWIADILGVLVFVYLTKVLLKRNS
jgi:VanZ family protein